MNRDGANYSLWQDGLLNFETNSTAPNTAFDVVIVGGGITGITSAFLLQEAGLKCLVCEARTIGFGTTSGTTAHLNTYLDANYYQVERDFGESESKLLFSAAREGIELVERLSNQYGIQSDFEWVDAFLLSQTNDQSQELERIHEASIRAGLNMRWVSEIPVSIPFDKAVHMEDQAQIHPTRYLFGLAQRFLERGGTILQNCLVTDVEKANGDELRVKTEQGEFIASRLIYATHVPPGVNLLHFRNAPYKSYAIAVTLEDENYPKSLIYDLYDAYHYIRTQEINGKKYLIVGGEDHKTAEDPNPEMRFKNLEAWVRKYFRVAAVEYKWSSQYFNPTDGLPYIGHLPGNPQNVYVATGFSGNGITLSQVAAITLTEILTSGSSRYEKLFRPSRVKPVAGFSNFVREQADVVSKLLSIPFDGKKIEGISDLAADEGRVVKYEGEKIALYKAPSGELHALDAACSHLYCTVQWNGSEKAWECPCHGSRFGVDGDVLTGPTQKPLKKIPLNQTNLPKT